MYGVCDFSGGDAEDNDDHYYYYDFEDYDNDGYRNEHRMANAIKGDPNKLYEIIRKNQGANAPKEDLVNNALVQLTPKDDNYGKGK
jgi:hypothetical protein